MTFTKGDFIEPASSADTKLDQLESIQEVAEKIDIKYDRPILIAHYEPFSERLCVPNDDDMYSRLPPWFADWAKETQLVLEVSDAQLVQSYLDPKTPDTIAQALTGWTNTTCYALTATSTPLKDPQRYVAAAKDFLESYLGASNLPEGSFKVEVYEPLTVTTRLSDRDERTRREMLRRDAIEQYQSSQRRFTPSWRLESWNLSREDEKAVIAASAQHY